MTGGHGDRHAQARIPCHSHVNRAIAVLTNTGPAQLPGPSGTNYVVVPYTVRRGGWSDDAGPGPGRRPGTRPSPRGEEETAPGAAARARGPRALIGPLPPADVRVYVRA